MNQHKFTFSLLCFFRKNLTALCISIGLLSPGFTIQALADSKVSVGPSHDEVSSWGYSYDEFKNLVDRKFNLYKKFRELGDIETELTRKRLAKDGFDLVIDKQEIAKGPIFDTSRATDKELYGRAVQDIERDLYMRRAAVRNMSPERFRQTGMNRQMIRSVQKEIDNFATKVRDMEGRVGALRNNPTRLKDTSKIKSKSPPPKRPGNQTRLREGVNRKGNIPEDQQPEIHRQKTGQIEGDEQPPPHGADTKKIPSQDESVSGSRTGVISRTRNKPPIKTTPTGGAASVQKDTATKITDKIKATVEPVKESVADKVRQARDAVKKHSAGILLVTANLETILQCKNSGVAARDCLARIMVSNGIAATVSMATQLLSQGSVIKLVLAGAATTAVHIKLVHDTAELLYHLQDWAGAEYERYQAEKRRDKFTRANMDSGSLDIQVDALRIKIIQSLKPIADKRWEGCNSLRKLEQTTKHYADLIRKVVKEVPGKEAIADLKKLGGRVQDQRGDSENTDEYIRQAGSALERLKTNITQAKADVESCDSEESGRTAVKQLNAAKNAFNEIKQISRVAYSNTGNSSSDINNAKSIVDRAFATKNQINAYNRKIPSYKTLEKFINQVNLASEGLTKKGGRFLIEVKALKQAFPDDMDSQTEYRFHELDQLIIRFQNQDVCNPQTYQRLYNNDAGSAVNAVLDVENLLKPLHGLHVKLSGKSSGGDSAGLSRINEIATQAEAFIRSNQNLFVIAEKCSKEEIADNNESSSSADDADGFKDAETSYGSNGEKTGDETDRTAEQTDTDDGFSDLGTEIKSTPKKEQVTYFDRKWLPRSWSDQGDSNSTRFHIYNTASRLAMAAAFAKYLDARVDNDIAKYIRQAVEHMKQANQYSFEPHKAWPDWQQRSFQFNKLADRISKRSLSQRNYLRKGLTSKLAGQANAMARQLETLSRGQAGSISNCDSLFFRIGYHLAYSAQLRLIASDAENAGLPKQWVRKVNAKASSNAKTASRYIAQTKPSAARAGCVDMKPLTMPLRTAAKFSSDHLGTGFYDVWSKGKEMMRGGEAEGPVSNCGGELAGTWVMTSVNERVVRYEKRGGEYHGRYLAVVDFHGVKNYQEGQIYEKLRRVGERDYHGIKKKWVRDRYVTEKVKYRVFGDYFNEPKESGVYLYHFARIPNHLVGSIKPRINGVEKSLYLKGYTNNGDFWNPPDCTKGQKAGSNSHGLLGTGSIK